MDLTSLSGGWGFYFPPCHLVDMCGFRILFDCPLDLSALTIFSPIITDSNTLHREEAPAKSLELPLDGKKKEIEKCLDASNLIPAKPWYKTVKTLHMWDPSFIDIVLLSSPAGMLGLPFLTRNKDFAAKVYATEATIKLGWLLMKDLVTMDMEFMQLYGPDDSIPQWMKWEELEILPLALKQIVLGRDGTELGCWMPLYSAADLANCMKKVQALKYAEEACYNGALIIKAISSGLDIGTCNWTINGPKTNFAMLSSSVFWSAAARNFDYHALDSSDMIIYSDFSLCVPGTMEDDNNCPSPHAKQFPKIGGVNSCNSPVDDNRRTISESLLIIDESSEDTEKLDFICSCIISSVKDGGSVLVPIGRFGIVLQLLEQIADALLSLDLKVPIFIISSIAEELLAYFNIIPEWLCQLFQERLYSGQSLFVHEKLRKEKRLHLFPALHSLELIKNWQEPCIAFCPHWSLRLGPSVHLLRRWSGDKKSLLVLEEGVDAELALLPFKPILMKVLQCSLASGVKCKKIQPLLDVLQPKLTLFPAILKQHVEHWDKSPTFRYYSENETIHVDDTGSAEIEISADLVMQLNFMCLKEKDLNIARLSGDLLVEQGKYRVMPRNNQVGSPPS